jgi:hypothetical protein
MRCIVITFAFSVLALFSCEAQIIGNAPSGFRLDGAVTEWDQKAPTFGSVGGRTLIWIAQNKLGLVIAGTSSLDNSYYRTEPGAPKVGIDLWVSPDEKLEMPPIGFSGMELTETYCSRLPFVSPTGKEACADWIRQQRAYRGKLSGLFVRMWRIERESTVENYASPLFASLSEVQRTALSLLKPVGLPVSKNRYWPVGPELLL